jgi:hypothetical protein
MYKTKEKNITHQTLLHGKSFSLANTLTPHSLSHFKSLSSSGVRSISALGTIYEQF